ncbi:MAG: leucine--tRNA ligase [Sphingobacteriales bacterium]|nr:leucine--tRNA ligase [Sphingobacteriales bacterium]
MDIQFNEIEQQCHDFWENHHIYRVNNNSSRPKFYILDMFPYPSGAGLHVGHPLGYIATDIYARYKRMKGFNVLHPMGFDAFGLPAEQYAIQTGQHPAVTTAQNIATYKKQLQLIGLNFDWERQVNTSDPNFYRWTQWIFLQFFDSWYNKNSDRAEPIATLIAAFEQNGNKNIKAACTDTASFDAAQWKAMSEEEQQRVLLHYRLAYLGESEVWWCEGLNSVLANDEVKDGFSERGGFPAERRKMRQWFLRITAYADRLLQGLNDIEWSESIKEQQRHWIGKSQGAEIDFYLTLPAPSEQKVRVFTTRPDTIFGVTFMVLAPEHELVSSITTAEQRNDVEAYIAYVKRRSERERQAEKKISGVFTGAYVTHPFTDEPIPVWISEYVLAGYGTGAIMAVPADDERDYNFAKHFNLPIVDIIDKSKYPNATIEDKLGVMINSDFLDGMEVPAAIEEVIRIVEEEGIGEGRINYRLRDAGFSRQRFWGEPFPIVYHSEAADALPYPIPVSELPLELPSVQNYSSSGGKAPLYHIKEWAFLPNGTIRETDTMPGNAGSSWYYLRYMDAQNDQTFASPEALNYWQQVDFYVGGSEHAVGHLLYARMWHKFLCDKGYLHTQEPFKKLLNQGMIQGRSNMVYRLKDQPNTFVSAGLLHQYECSAMNVWVNLVDRDDYLDLVAFKQWRPDLANAEFILENGKYKCGVEVEKMSKSKFNTVSPDDMIAQYGADCFRMFEMFLGPIEQHKPWDTKGIEGVSKFLRKFARLFERNEQWSISDEAPTREELKILHRAIKKISEDIERFSHNTCVSAFMVCVNDLGALQCNKIAILEPLLRLLAPFAPFITEYFWQKLDKTGSIHHAAFPELDEQYLVESDFEYPIMINGKLRSKIVMPLDLDETAAQNIVLADEKVQQWTNGGVKRFILVKGRIVNIVA